MKTQLRTATANDFELGTELITPDGFKFKITKPFSEGVWEAKCNDDHKCIRVSDAHKYKVESK